MTRSPDANIYHRILKLPQNITEPDAYQLLGVARFEPDLKAIKHAAMDRNALLQRMQNAENYEDVKRLEREVGEAMVFLTNPETKADYDRSLASQVSASEPQRNHNALTTNKTTHHDGKSVQQTRDKNSLPGEAPWRSPVVWWRSHSSLLKGIVIGLSVALLLGLLFAF